MQERFAATATASAALALAAVTFAATGARSCAAPRGEPALEPPPAAAPWTLTASDGSGLRLARVDAKGVVEGPLAFTELHLYFHNPEARVREGTFAITLPPGATLSRFAMEHETGFHEGEVVARSLARRAYEDFLHRRQDPALLERAAGNLFTARVFPIPASGDKHLVISFVHELAGGAYVLPLHGLPPTPRIDVVVDAARLDGSRVTHQLHERAWLPDRDFVVGTVGPGAVAAGALVAAAVPIRAPSSVAAADPPRSLTLLVDTSASRALGFARYAGEVRDLVEALRARYGGQLELEVAAFDQEVRPIYRGPASGYDGAAHAALVERGAAGASDVGAAVAWLAGSAAHRRVAIVTDGVATAGEEAPAIAAALRRLGGEQRLERLDVVLAGGIRDEVFAAGLARAGLPRAGDVYDLDRGAAEVAAGLGEAVLVDVEVEVPGATWVSPRRLPAVRAGGAPVMVYAALAAPAPAFDVIVGGERRTIEPARGTRSLIERAMARAEIEALERRLGGLDAGGREAAALRREIERRAVAARVVSSQTAMIVLETARDYARYGIDRKALAEILFVGPGGLEAAGLPGGGARPWHEGKDRAWTTGNGWSTGRGRRPDGGEGQAPSTDTGPGRYGAAGAGYKMQLDEGRADPQLSRQQAIELARQAGIIGSTRPGFASLIGTADLSSGFDDSNLSTAMALEEGRMGRRIRTGAAARRSARRLRARRPRARRAHRPVRRGHAGARRGPPRARARPREDVARRRAGRRARDRGARRGARGQSAHRAAAARDLRLDHRSLPVARRPPPIRRRAPRAARAARTRARARDRHLPPRRRRSPGPAHAATACSPTRCSAPATTPARSPRSSSASTSARATGPVRAASTACSPRTPA